jgi:hypothetical protein
MYIMMATVLVNAHDIRSLQQLNAAMKFIQIWSVATIWRVENSVLVKLGKPQIQVDRPYILCQTKRNSQEVLCPSFVYQRVY